ncbi:MAG: hypothetical protein QME94_13280, partial [Anaerolineae bacterium]|nr:hypothetical protein [Anaerolineae bacterium]
AALEEVGETMRAFRCRYGLGRPGGDYSAVREFITTGATPRAVRRAAFGLPLQFYYTSLPGDAPEGRKATIAGGAGLDRSASPLHLRVVPLAGGDCAVVALIFVAPLLPAGSRLHLESRRHRATCAVPNQSVLTEYLDAVKAQMGHWLEVRYG